MFKYEPKSALKALLRLESRIWKVLWFETTTDLTSVQAVPTGKAGCNVRA